MVRAPIVRFWEHVLVDPTPEACWLWRGGQGTAGYGAFKDRSYHMTGAHRWLYQHLHGPLPPGIRVLHRCDVKRCVRPSHLWAGTAQENTRDMVAKGRRRGGTVRLTAVDVTAIRMALAMRHQAVDIARAWGVSEACVHRIKHRLAWRDVP